MGAGIADGLDLAFHAAVPKTAGDKDAAHIGKEVVRVFFCNGF